MSSPEYLSRITKKMAAVLGGHYNDKEPIFLEDSMKIRTKKKYINLCLFALRFLAILVSISLIMAVIISLYKYDKGLKKTVIFVDTGCVSCDLLNSSAQSIEGVELKASTQTSIHQIVTESDFFDEGNVTEKDDITETRNETEIINLSGQAGVVSEKSHIPPASPPASSPSPPIHPPPLSPPASSPSSPIHPPTHLSPPASSPIHPPTPLSPPASSHSSSIHPPAHLSPPASSPIHPPSPANPPPPAPPLATPSTPPSPPATPSTPPPPPPPATPPPPPHSSLVEKESQSDYHENIKYSEYHKNYARPRSISTSSVYDTVMGYVRPVKDFVFGLVNRFLSLFSV